MTDLELPEKFEWNIISRSRIIFWKRRRAHMKRAPRNRHDTSSRPGWILHVMFRLGNIWFLLLTCREKNALFAWKRRRKSSSSLCSPPSKLRPSISSRSSSQCIHHVRPHPHWYVCLHTAITRLIGSSQRKLAASKCKKWRHLLPAISFFFKNYKHRHYHFVWPLWWISIPPGAISEWFKRPTTVSVSSDFGG